VNEEPLFWHRVAEITADSSYHDVLPGTCSLEGRALDPETREPVANVSIRLRNLTLPQSNSPALKDWWQWTTKTNQNGFYKISRLPPGVYEIVANIQGSGEAFPEIISIRPGESVDFDMILF